MNTQTKEQKEARRRKWLKVELVIVTMYFYVFKMTAVMLEALAALLKKRMDWHEKNGTMK